MDLDQLLFESGARWRQAQGPGPRLDVERLVTDQRPTESRRWWTAMTAAAVVLATVAAVFFVRQAVEPTVTRATPAPPVAIPSGVTPGQLFGTWYHAVSLTMARTQHRTLVGRWVLTLDPGGSARLARVDGTVNVPGRWSLSAGTLALTLPLTGCTDAASDYRPDRSTLTSGLLELVPGDEPCQARAIVLGGHWFSTPSPG